VCAHARISRPTLDAIYSLRFLEWKERGEESRLAGNASQIEIFHNILYLRMEGRFLK
jgi:hypothetical protein